MNLGLKNFVVRSQKFNGARGFVASEFGGRKGFGLAQKLRGNLGKGLRRMGGDEWKGGNGGLGGLLIRGAKHRRRAE